MEQRTAFLPGYERRFWQGSHDHRGTPERPGRVVTLTPVAGASCVGAAYLIDAEVVQETFEQLDHREKNGYERFEVSLHFDTGDVEPGLVYMAVEGNFAFAGEAPMMDIAKVIHQAHGPSGANKDYLFNLAEALRQLEVIEPHVFELEALVRQLDGGQAIK